MKISVVIPAHNEEKYVGACLESIVEHASKDLHEIIVIDNVSTDNTAAIAKRFKEVRVVYEPKKGLTRARQRGLEEATGDLIAYLDADTKISSHWMPLIHKEFLKHKDLVCLSGPYKYYDMPRIKAFIANLCWNVFAPATYRLVGYMVLGGNFVAKRETLIAMGGFDTTISFYGEDTNIAWRLHKFGKVLFNMKFFVNTSGRRLTGEGLARIFFIYGVNFVWGVLFHKPFTIRYKDVR